MHFLMKYTSRNEKKTRMHGVEYGISDQRNRLIFFSFSGVALLTYGNIAQGLSERSSTAILIAVTQSQRGRTGSAPLAKLLSATMLSALPLGQ
eukprot:IDg12475t1